MSVTNNVAVLHFEAKVCVMSELEVMFESWTPSLAEFCRSVFLSLFICSHQTAVWVVFC